MSESNVTTTSPKKSESSLASRVGFGLLILLLSGVVIVYGVLYFGSVSGEEFAPDSFQRRRFSYVQLPLIGFQITPVRHTDITNDLEKYIVAQKFFTKSSNGKPRWNLVNGSEGVASHTRGDAQILCQYLNAVNKDGDEWWLKWSEEHGDLEKILWPAVAKVARDELYSFVPELFILARTATSADEFQQSVDDVLADQYLLTAETFEELGQTEVAAELFAEVLHHAPDRIDEVGGRNKSVATP